MNSQVFIQAIRDDPEDDLPRQAFADWLEEQGDAPRGEMIRLQIELTCGVPDRARAIVLLRRLRELVVAHRRRWMGPLHEVDPDAIFERGFVEELRLSAREFLRRGAAVLTDHPITRLVLTETSGAMGDVADCSGLAYLASLSLRGEALRGPDVLALARSSHLRRLRSLDLRRCQVTATGMEALLSSQSLPRLESLDLSFNEIGDGLGPLLRLPGLPALRRLDLSGIGITGRTVAYLLSPTWLSRLKSLSLALNNLSAADVERVATSSHLASLESINLFHPRIPEGTVRRLRQRFSPRVVL